VVFLDILVIGDKKHGRATCVDWMEDFPNIEEFDLIIIGLNMLTQKIFDKIPEKPRSIADEIGTVWGTGRPVWCIMEDVLTPSRPAGGPKAVFGTRPSNYDWLPLPIVVRKVKEGSTVQLVDSMVAEKFRPYFDMVKRWDLEIQDDHRLLGKASGIGLAPIATNKSDKMISAAMFFDTIPGAGISFLPKPTTCSTYEAIEVLIDIATGKDRLEPEWRDQIEIPGISKIDTEIKQREAEAALVQKMISELKAKRIDLEKYRNVFSVHEDPQVEAVKKILREIGIETERTQPAFVIDLLGKEAAIEITSTAGKIDSNSKKMFQLTQFIEKHHKNEKIILVANTYKREDPKTRTGKEDFTPPVIDYLKSNQVCAMTSLTLLELWKKERSTAKDKIMQTTGELRVS
jgi:hypothetical protein